MAFAAAYLTAYRAYVRDPGEATLRGAYELGREAVAAGLGILDVALAHHDALLAMVEDEGIQRTVRSGADFLVETLSAFEMVQRGFRETRDAVAHERRRAEILRQLSDFLSDASLALDASHTLDEVLQLVAEQARELVGADCCMVTMGSEPQAHPRAASHETEGDTRWSAFVRWTDLSRIDATVRAAGRAAPIDPTDAEEHLRRPEALRSHPSVRAWLGARMVGLDGREIGCIHLVNDSQGRFTTLDEAILVQLAQMSVAAVERARAYAARQV